jgi:hypothetical protein
MGAELDSYKLRLIENKIKAKRETLERLEISNARRIKNKFKRMRFIGDPKSFQEVLSLTKNTETFTLKSRERLFALEEFRIYGNSLLQTFKVGTHVEFLSEVVLSLQI